MSVWKRAAGSVAVLALLSIAQGAGAATWTGGGTTPTLGDIVVIDATGETEWPYGFEDLAGDDETFEQAEQAVDIRTAYATTDNTHFWFRTYMSSEIVVGADVTVYVFIDADENPATGGDADAEIDPDLGPDPTGGGYEFAFGVRGDGLLVGVWTWDNPSSSWVLNPDVVAPEGESEAEVDVDSILVGAASHGYVQASIDQSLLGLDPACDARLFIRSLDASTADTNNFDVETPCIPSDTNDDGVPDILVPEGCTSDDQCPFGGVCVDGECVLTEPCEEDGDCDADEVCDDGQCVVIGGD